MRRRGWQGVLVACFGTMLLLVGSAATAAADWPQWRGPSRDGVAPEAKLPDPWPKELRQLWKVRVGAGYPGPVIAGDKVVVFARQEEKEVILCLAAADGKELWRDAYDAPYTPPGSAERHGKGPFATPTVAGDKVYAAGVSGILSCCDLKSGKTVWREAFADLKKAYPSWGASNSPLIEGNLCIVGFGRGETGGVAGFDKETGKNVWKLPGDGPAYASAIAADLAGQRQAITLTFHKIVAVAPATGKLLWEAPFEVQYEQNVVTPVVYKDLVICSGWQTGTVAFRIAKADGKLTAQRVWHNEGVSMYMSSPVVAGDHLYALATAKKGSLVCLRLEDGQVAWNSPGNLGEYASIVRAGDRLLALTMKGELVAFAADPSAYRELGRGQVGERPVYAHLALAGSRLYVRDRLHLICFEMSAE